MRRTIKACWRILAYGSIVTLLAFYLEPLWPLGDRRWLFAALAAIITMVIWEFYDHNPEGFRNSLRDRLTGISTWLRMNWEEVRIDDFEMPIRDAIMHMVEEIPHSFERSRYAETAAFERLHEKMCSGDIPVVGATGEFEAPTLIPLHKVRNLDPAEVVVPRNPSTPEGVRYSLVEKRLPEDGTSSGTPVSEYRNLRVRDWDVYRIWPKARRLR